MVLVGTGEVTRCLAVRGTGRVRAVLLAAQLRPFLLNMNGPEGSAGAFRRPAGRDGHTPLNHGSSDPAPQARRVLGRPPRSLSTVTPVAAGIAWKGYPAIRSNSLPSMSAKVVQRDLPACWSRSL